MSEATCDASALPPNRLELARRLLDISDSEEMADEDTESAWNEDIAHRLHELRSGQVKRASAG